MSLHDWLQLDQLAPPGWVLPLRRLLPPPEWAAPALASLSRVIATDGEKHDPSVSYLSEESHWENRAYPEGFLKCWAEAGLGAIIVPSTWGGWGDRALRFNWLLMELAAYDVGRAITIGATALASIPIFLAGTPTAKQWCSERILAGKMGALALTEPDTGSDLARNQSLVGRRIIGTENEIYYELSGEKTLINGGSEASFAVTLWRLEPENSGMTGEMGPVGHSLALIDLTSNRVRKRSRYPLSGAVQADVSGFILDGYRVTPPFHIGPPNRGLAIVRRTLSISRGCIPAIAIGTACRAFSEALLYAGDRHVYGRRLLDIEHPRQMLCSMYSDLFLASALCLKQSVITDAFPGSLTDLVAATKFYGCRVPQLVVTRASRLFAARGFLAGTPIEKIKRDVALMEIFDGAYPLQLDETFRRAGWLKECLEPTEAGLDWIHEYAVNRAGEADRRTGRREVAAVEIPESDDLPSVHACRAAWRVLRRLDSEWRSATDVDLIADPLRSQRVKFLLAAGWADLQALIAATEALHLAPQQLRWETRVLLKYAAGEFALRTVKLAEEVMAHVPSGVSLEDELREIRSLTSLIHTSFSDMGTVLEGLLKDLAKCRLLRRRAAGN